MKLLAHHPLICAQISQSQREILLSKRAEKKKEGKTERLSINIFLHTSTEYYDIYFWHTIPKQGSNSVGGELNKKKKICKKIFLFFFMPPSAELKSSLTWKHCLPYAHCVKRREIALCDLYNTYPPLPSILACAYRYVPKCKTQDTKQNKTCSCHSLTHSLCLGTISPFSP